MFILDSFVYENTACVAGETTINHNNVQCKWLEDLTVLQTLRNIKLNSCINSMSARYIIISYHHILIV